MIAVDGLTALAGSLAKRERQLVSGSPLPASLMLGFVTSQAGALQGKADSTSVPAIAEERNLGTFPVGDV